MHRQQIVGSGMVLGTVLVLALVGTGVMQHRRALKVLDVAISG
jgi:hypothetical protein